ncbi:MAG: HTTM domain-containing protein [Myxococcales bacterium]|nr:HTTM domain-containing protein [Myxococcales bacterium]
MLASADDIARLVPLLGAASLVAALAIAGLVAAHADALRRVLMRAVDPRPLALLRVAFALLLLLSLVEISPLNSYLYSDEGLLQSAAVPQVFGRAALVGFGDGVSEPAGFTSPRGALEFVIRGRWSLLYFWDSPAFVRGYFAALLCACVGLALGWRTRLCAALAWLLYVGLLRRSDAHWGGEQLFCALLFLLMLSRSGAALSVDRWRRRRRAGGELALPRVPAWPQALIATQLAICYGVNGWMKSGPLWRSGDALWFALHLDRYTRLDWHGLSLSLGTWPLRLASWSVLWWERLFPLLLAALWVQALARARAPALAGACGSRRARVLARARGRASRPGRSSRARSGSLVTLSQRERAAALGLLARSRWCGWLLRQVLARAASLRALAAWAAVLARLRAAVSPRQRAAAQRRRVRAGDRVGLPRVRRRAVGARAVAAPRRLGRGACRAGPRPAAAPRRRAGDRGGRRRRRARGRARAAARGRAPAVVVARRVAAGRGRAARARVAARATGGREQRCPSRHQRRVGRRVRRRAAHGLGPRPRGAARGRAADRLSPDGARALADARVAVDAVARGGARAGRPVARAHVHAPDLAHVRQRSADGEPGPQDRRDR